MADQIMTVVESSKTGILDVEGNGSALAGNAAGTDQFLIPNDGKTVLVVVGGGTPADIVFTPITNQYGRTESLSVTPGTSVTSIIGPFPPRLWNNAAGQVEFDPTGGGQAGDTYLAVRIP